MLCCSKTGRLKTGLFFCAFLAGVLGASPAVYAEDNPAVSPAATENVRIETDQDKGTITFIIDGKAVAQINRDGFHVVESINYGGVLTDPGSDYVREMIGEKGEDEE